MPLGQVSLDTLYMQMQEGKVKELDIVLKCDVQGSAEAIKNALTKVGEENIKVRLIHEGIGDINETDVHLASASGAVIIGFNVKADGAAQRQAQKEGVDIRVIQDLLGHRNINTTTRYARVAVNMIRQVESPLEALRMELVPPA